MIHRALGRQIPVELTADPRVVGRVRRLAVVSAIMLGLIWGLAAATTAAPAFVLVVLFSGWILMPVVLIASLTSPTARYWLAIPSTLVSLGLLAIVLLWLPSDAMAAMGWLLITAGVLLGGAMGLWLWFRVLPVPPALDDPLSAGRWTLIGAHVAMVVTGAVFVIAPAVSS